MTPRERGQTLVERARSGLPVAWREGDDWHRLELAGADAEDADLRGADLHRADLRGAKLGRATLRDADARLADLREADLRGACLVGADLRGADLGDADLRGADLAGAVVDRTTFLRSGWSMWPAWVTAGLGLVFDAPDGVALVAARSAEDPTRAAIAETMLAAGELLAAIDRLDRAWHGQGATLEAAQAATRRGVAVVAALVRVEDAL
ncbi:MAG: pentapeptide repeat-containing protein [Alphaproteobacteria bacterium]|nr:pentapeptide repeat-containing protein [Alphaproteobacteria bacterium]